MPLDHIGWRLWDAATVWKEKFADEMVAMGHDWYREARSSVIPFVKKDGTRQVDIVEKMGLSKQAVQQLIADLESSGILWREPDPQDKRGKIVRFTEEGFSALRDGQTAKRKIEAEVKAQLGDEDFTRLMRVLKRLGSEA